MRTPCGLPCGLIAIALLCGNAEGAKPPEWVASMKTVHAKFTGEAGSFGQFGDSISHSKAFWSSLEHGRKKVPPKMAKAFKIVDAYMDDIWWDGKGPEYGNLGQMTIRWAHANVDKWLKTTNFETVSLMFGANDLGPLKVKEYEAKTRDVIKRILENGTVVILSTLAPKNGAAAKAAVFADAVRKIAKEMKVPLVDYQQEILKRRPDDWNGRLPKFSEYSTYEVPTLISKDGVHPSNGAKWRGDYTEQGLRNNGFLLWSHLVLMKYADVIQHVYGLKDEAPDAPEQTVHTNDFETEGEWNAIWNDSDAGPKGGKRCLEGKPGTTFFAQRIRVGVRPPATALKKMYVTFDYFVTDSNFLQVFLFNKTLGDNAKFHLTPRAQGKWTTATVRVTSMKMRKGHVISELHFFAGTPGNKKTKLLIDNVRLHGRGK